jgi:hypothetical protein
MLRVLGTLKRSVYAQDFESQINDLGNWVSEIHGGMYPHLVRSLLRTYLAHLKLPFAYLPVGIDRVDGMCAAAKRSIQKLRRWVQQHQRYHWHQ